MKRLSSIGAITLALSVGVAAQDSTVKSRSQVKADDATVVSMTGCLQQDVTTGSYTLVGSMAAAGDELTTKSKTKTDVDRDSTTVKNKTTTSADNGAVATSGSMASYAIIPGDRVDLSSHVGQQVQLSAIVVERGHGDADVTIKDKTTVDPEHADDSTSRSKTKLELPKSPLGSYSVVSLKALGGSRPPH